MTNNKQTHYNYSTLTEVWLSTEWVLAIITMLLIIVFIITGSTSAYYIGSPHLLCWYFYMGVILCYGPTSVGWCQCSSCLACIPIRGWLTATQGDVSILGDGCFSGAEGDLMARVHCVSKHTQMRAHSVSGWVFIVCTPQLFHSDMYVQGGELSVDFPTSHVRQHLS